MARQERSARRERRAAAQADKIVEQATRKVKKAKPATESQKPVAPTQRRAGTRGTTQASSTTSVDLSAECKRLRDEQGMAWWRIGHELGLPGSADNVKAGKGGAAQARRLYAQANGGVPHVPRTRQAREKVARTPRHAANVGPKVDRKIQLLEQGHVIPTDTTDEEVLAMIRGRTIEWGINVGRLCGDPDGGLWLNQEARVHPVDVIMEEEPDTFGGRVVRFREYLGIDEHGRHMSGPTRTVRVNSIHTVR